MRIPISIHGLPYIGITLVISLIVHHFSAAAAVPFWILTALIVNFFRDPERTSLDSPAGILSPADGRIIEISPVTHPKLGDHMVKISIFMNVFNVHVNRAPLGGTVFSVEHVPGKYLNAADPDATEENERVEYILNTEAGPMAVRLVAGLIARRIVHWKIPDEKVKRGERISLIKFGSRVDLYMKDHVRIEAGMNDRVYAGITRLATIQNADIQSEKIPG